MTRRADVCVDPGSEPRRLDRAERGQANLPVVAVALVILTAVTGMTVAMAEGAHLGAERDVEERAAAVSTADRFVAADVAHTRRANVLDAATLSNVSATGATLSNVSATNATETGATSTNATETDVTPDVPTPPEADVRIRVDDAVVYERGDPEGGTTIRRLALLATDETWKGTVDAGSADRLDLPARTVEVDLVAEGDVESIRVDDRVVAHASSGAVDPVRVGVHPSRDPVVSATGDRGTVHATASIERTERVVVEVTVDA